MVPYDCVRNTCRFATKGGQRDMMASTHARALVSSLTPDQPSRQVLMPCPGLQQLGRHMARVLAERDPHPERFSFLAPARCGMTHLAWPQGRRDAKSDGLLSPPLPVVPCLACMLGTSTCIQGTYLHGSQRVSHSPPPHTSGCGSPVFAAWSWQRIKGGQTPNGTEV